MSNQDRIMGSIGGKSYTKNGFITPTVEMWGCDHCHHQFSDKTDCVKHEKTCDANPVKFVPTCFKCGRKGHLSPSCNASTHLNGSKIIINIKK